MFAWSDSEDSSSPSSPVSSFEKTNPKSHWGGRYYASSSSSPDFLFPTPLFLLPVWPNPKIVLAICFTPKARHFSSLSMMFDSYFSPSRTLSTLPVWPPSQAWHMFYLPWVSLRTIYDTHENEGVKNEIRWDIYNESWNVNKLLYWFRTLVHTEIRKQTLHIIV